MISGDNTDHVRPDCRALRWHVGGHTSRFSEKLMLIPIARCESSVKPNVGDMGSRGKKAFPFKPQLRCINLLLAICELKSTMNL